VVLRCLSLCGAILHQRIDYAVMEMEVQFPNYDTARSDDSDETLGDAFVDVRLNGQKSSTRSVHAKHADEHTLPLFFSELRLGNITWSIKFPFNAATSFYFLAFQISFQRLDFFSFSLPAVFFS
jgi:hypothetical protein